MREGLEVSQVRKRFGKSVILEDLGFGVQRGEVFALLGASGSGKSTALNIIAGLEEADAGSVSIAGVQMRSDGVSIPAHARDVGMVFQDQMLWPHLTVAQHLDFVLRARGVPRSKWEAMRSAQLAAVCLQVRDDALPGALSGGERQRLSIARALVASPSVLLLDEPCSNLDTPLKAEVLALLGRLCGASGRATVYVTHDAREVFELANKVGVLEHGRLVQVGAPEEVCEQPATAMVARLVGGGSLVTGQLTEERRFKTAFGEMQVHEFTQPGVGREVEGFVREDDLRLDPAGRLRGVVVDLRYQRRAWVLEIEANGASMRVWHGSKVALGERIELLQVRPVRVFPKGLDSQG